MKQLVAFLVIATILGAAGFFILEFALGSKNAKNTAMPGAPVAKHVEAFSVRSARTKAFDKAKIAFQTPSRMQLGKSKDVNLLLNLKKTIEELRTELGKEFPTQGAQIQAAPVMEATLSGGAFDIRAASPPRQAIRDSGNTTWEWSVIPREKGQHTLKLKLYAIVTLQGATAPMEVKTFERDIPVDVSVSELLLGFVKNNTQIIWLALVVPIAGFLSRRFKAKQAA